MKILALNGSYRSNGNTARVINLIEEQMRREAVRAGVPLEFEKVDLGLLNLQLCRGCRACFDRGEDQCPLKDDLLPVKAKMKAADGIIIATPV
jgi:multimeric flavodoxin WrbA